MLQELTTQKSTKSPRKVLWTVVAATLTLGAVLAFTAANVVPDSKAGDGSGEITGYEASDIHYELNDVDPSIIDAIEFTLDSEPVAGSTMKVQAVDGGTWYDCVNAGEDLTCDTTGTQLDVLDVDQLRVIVAD